jgi:hypothetical protein
MPAKVIFSDGSKAMAHNLDDLRERWLARRQKEEYVWQVTLDPPLIHDWENPASIEQAKQWKLEAQRVLAATDMDLAQINAEDGLGAKLFNARRGRLVMQKTYYVHVVTVLNATIKGEFVANWTTDRQSVLRNTENNLNERLAAAIDERDRLLTQLASSGSFTEYEIKFVSALRGKDWAALLGMITFQMRLEKMTRSEARVVTKQEQADLENIEN